MQRMYSELRRRHVFKVAAVYGVVAWLIIQAASIAFPAFGAPDWALRIVIALAVLGFPVALVLAWAFELTPEGVKRTQWSAAEPADSAGTPAARRWAAAWLGAGILLGLLLVGTYGWLQTLDRAETREIRSVAVLPFANMSADSADAYFSDGISEEILNALSRVDGLRVPARTSSFRFRTDAADVREVARRLGVAAVLEGSVRRDGTRVKVGARLVNAADGYQIWSAAYDRELEDILAVQEEIAVAIANALQVKLAGENAARLARGRAIDPAAYELYLEGRHLASRRTRDDLLRAVGLFERALAVDPAFAAAYAGLADAYALSEDYGGVPREEAFPKAIAAARRALELDELQPEAHASLGHIYYHQGNWAASEREYRRALALNPSYATAHHWYGVLLMDRGRLEEAAAALDTAYELDPFSPKIREVRGLTMYYARRFERAASFFGELVHGDSQEEELLYKLAWVHLHSGAPDEAVTLMQRVLDLIPAGRPDAWARARLAAAYAGAGRGADARALLQELERMDAAGEASPSVIAVAYDLLGERDRALQWLNVAIERDDWKVEVWEIDPAFDSLRADPRFARLLERVRQRQARAAP